MGERLYKYLDITDLKDMLNKTRHLYANNIAYKIRNEDGSYKIFTHEQVRSMIDALGTALIDMGLKNKRIAVIGENRYEWEIAYLAIACGTGIVVPLDKSLPENELKALIARSEVEAIIYSGKYEEMLERIKYTGTGKLKHLISMDLEEHKEGIYSQKELIEIGNELIKNGDNRFINATINPEEMNIMLFTSGTTSVSKVVALSHKNICSNLMDIASTLDINSQDIFLSVLPIHHVFECTVGFLFALYKGAQTVFCDGIRHIVENLKEYHVSVMACVPAIYERIFRIIRRSLEKQGKLEEILLNEEKYKNATMEEKKEVFKEIHDMLGGNIKLFISGAAALDKTIEQKYGYIDEDGYIFICGRKKSVIVLKNGKNIFPEEMENLVNRIEGVKESFIFGKQMSDDKNDIKINVKIVFDREVVKNVYKVTSDEEIYIALKNEVKEINKTMPSYKAIRDIIITEKPLIKTTTNKIKRQANLDEIEKS